MVSATSFVTPLPLPAAFQAALLIAVATESAVTGLDASVATGAVTVPLVSSTLNAVVVTFTLNVFLPVAAFVVLLTTVLSPFSISTKSVMTFLPLGVMLLKLLSAALSILALVSASNPTLIPLLAAVVVMPFSPVMESVEVAKFTDPVPLLPAVFKLIF